MYAEPTGSRSFQRLSPNCCIVKFRKGLDNRSNLKPSNVLCNRLTTRLSISFCYCNKAANALLYPCAAGTCRKVYTSQDSTPWFQPTWSWHATNLRYTNKESFGAWGSECFNSNQSAIHLYPYSSLKFSSVMLSSAALVPRISSSFCVSSNRFSLPGGSWVLPSNNRSSMDLSVTPD